MAMSDLPIELEAPTGIQPEPDSRARMEEPLSVRLVAIADVTLPVIAGLEVDLDGFYVGMLEFVRDGDLRQLVYHADNFAIRFVVPTLLCVLFIVAALHDYDRRFPNPPDHFTPARATWSASRPRPRPSPSSTMPTSCRSTKSTSATASRISRWNTWMAAR